MTDDLPTSAAAPADDGGQAPARIWSQGYGGSEPTWCDHQVEPSDAEYVRADVVAALRATIAEISAKLVEAAQERDSARRYGDDWATIAGDATQRAQAAEARCAELETALRPFTGLGYAYALADVPRAAEDLRRARAALPADGAAQEGRDGDDV